MKITVLTRGRDAVAGRIYHGEVPVYLDHAATTSMSETAIRAMTDAMRHTGNASALHTAGRQARRIVEEAREQLAAAAGAHSSEVIFTSGGTEADNLALKGLFWQRRDADPARNRILVSTIEHHAVLDTVTWLEKHEGAELTWLEVNQEGVVTPETLAAAINSDPGTINLVSLMWANNEIGSLQRVKEAVALADAHGIPVHSDAVQAFGSIPLSFKDSGLAAMSISAHKIGGPIGVGALLLRRDVKLVPVLHGGGQERDVRSGTFDTPAIAGFGAVAAEVAAGLAEESARLGALRDRLITGIQEAIPSAVLRGATGQNRLPGNVHFTFPGCEGDSLLFLLDMAGVQSSTGSACTAGVPRPSHVLLAMGLDEDTARGAQRFSLGHTSTEHDVDALLAALPAAFAQASKAGMAGHESSIQTAGTMARE